MKSPIEKRSIVVGGPPDFFDIERSALDGKLELRCQPRTSRNGSLSIQKQNTSGSSESLHGDKLGNARGFDGAPAASPDAER